AHADAAGRLGGDPGGHLRTLVACRRSLLRPGTARLGAFPPLDSDVGVPVALARVRHARRRLPLPHLEPGRPCLRADRGQHAARRRSDEARRLRRDAGGDGPLPGGGGHLGADRGRGRGGQHPLRRALRRGAGRPQVHRGLLQRQPHGRGDARGGHADPGGLERGGVPDVRPRHHDRALLRPGGPGLRASPHPGPRQDGRLRARDAGHRRLLHAGSALLARAARDGRLRRRVPRVPRCRHRTERLVDGARGARCVRHRGLRAAGLEDHLLGSGPGGALLASLRPAAHRVGCAGGPLRVPGGLRLLAAAPARRHRRHHLRVPQPGGAGGGGARAMTPWLQLLGPAMAVAAIGALVLGGDALWPGRGRLWGWISVVLLLALLFVPPGTAWVGVAPHRAYVAGTWSLFLQRVLVVSVVLAILGSMDWLESRVEGRQAEYLALLLFSTSGMMMIPGARDWALLVGAFELMGIPLYALVAWAKNDGPPERPRLAAEAGLKLFVTGTASSALTFFGLALVVGLTGSSRIDAIVDPGRVPLAAVGMLLIVAGF